MHAMASTLAQHIEDLKFRVLKILHDKPDTSRFLKRKTAEYEVLKADIEALQAVTAAEETQKNGKVSN